MRKPRIGIGFNEFLKEESTQEEVTSAAIKRVNEFPAGRLLRDAKLYDIGAGTNEIRRMLIGRELFEKSL